MSEYDEYDENEQEQQEPERTSAEWAKLRRAEKARKQAEAEAAEVKKQMAFLKAGIDPDSPKAKYFVKGYEGEINAEAIRQEALAAGIIEEQPEQVDQPALDAQDRIAAAGSGVGQGDMELAVAQLDQAFATGGTAGMLQHLQQMGVPVNNASGYIEQ